MADDNKRAENGLAEEELRTAPEEEVSAESGHEWTMSEIDGLLGDENVSEGEEELDYEPEYDLDAAPFEADGEQLTLTEEAVADEEPAPLDSGVELGAVTEEAPELPEEPAAEEIPEEETPVEEAELPEEPDEEELSTDDDEPDYVPGIVRDEEEEPAADFEEEPVEEEKKKLSFKDRVLSFRNSLVRVVEGGESEGEFAEEDLVDTVEEPREEAPLPKRSGILPTRRGKEAAKEDANVRTTSELYKGLDENPQSPKMIMELADEKGELSREEKRALAQKTVGIRPFHNENIEHQIKKVRTEAATAAEPVAAEESPEAAAAGAVEAAAVVSGEVTEKLGKTRKFVNTSELEPVPTIIDANAELNTFDKAIVAKGDTKTIEHDTEMDGQIRLAGFDDEDTTPEQVDEDDAEEELRSNRVQKIQEFKLAEDFIDESALSGDPESDTREFNLQEEAPTPNQTLWELRTGNPRINHSLYTADYLSDDFKEETDYTKVKAEVEKNTKKSLIAAIIQAVLMVAGLVLTTIITLSGGNLAAIGGSATTGVLINMILVLAAAVVGRKTIRKGIHGFINKHINASGAATIVVLATFLEDLLLILIPSASSDTAGLYTGAACLAMLLPSVARYLTLRRAKDNLTFITSGLQLYDIDIVDSEDDTASIVRGMQMDDSVICYNGKLKSPSNFVRNSFADDPADYYAEKPTLIILALAVLYAVIFGLVRHSFAVGLSGFAVVCCIAIPAFSLLVSNISLFLDDYRFSRKGSAILGHRAVEESAYVNTYAIDSTDLFPKGSCNIVGIKTFHNMRVDDAILYSAALVIESKGPLTDAFENTILGKNDLLPPVETLTYEERLGLSAWIHGRRVLFGNRALMVNHNVDLPDTDFEAQYKQKKEKVLYLAIAGKVAAMFVVKYRPSKRLRKNLRHMDRSGITILIHNTDCNINEEMVCKYYKLPETAVKVLSPAAGDKVEDYLADEKWTSESGILHNGTLTAAMRTLYEARRLYDGVSINNVLSAAYSILAVITAIILGATSTSGILSMSDGKIVLFQIIWGILAVGLPILRSRNAGK